MKILIGGIVAAVALGALAAFLFLKLSSPSAYTVLSDDGKMELEIPASALSKKSLLEEISVARVSAEDARGVPVAMYKLSPEGLTFSEPVKLTATIEIEPGDVPFGFHVDTQTGGISSIENYRALLDYGLKVATITGTIDHFSYIFVSKVGMTASIVHPKSNLLVGRTREVHFSLTAGKEAEYFVKGDDFTTRHTRKGDATVMGELNTSDDTIIPRRILNALPEAILPPGGTVQGSGTFTCIEAGPAVPYFEFRVAATIETAYLSESAFGMAADFLFGQKVYREYIDKYPAWFFVKGEGYNCIGAPVDSPQQTAPKVDSAKETTPTEEAGAKICGGIFGPCDEKK